MARKFKAIFDGYGGVNCRLLSAVVGGEATGTVAFTTEVDDWAAFGVLMQKLYSDPEAMALISSSTSGDGPAVDGRAQVALWVDVPL